MAMLCRWHGRASKERAVPPVRLVGGELEDREEREGDCLPSFSSCQAAFRLPLVPDCPFPPSPRLLRLLALSLSLPLYLSTVV